MLWSYLLAFFGVALADVCWTYYVIEVGARRAVRAGIWSGGIVALSGAAVVQYANDWRTVFAGIAGAFVGTYLAMRIKERRRVV